MPYTVTQTARAANISPSTIRLWSKEYQDYLSPGARPGKGEQRLYTADDIAVFRTVKAMRDNLATADQILTALDNGERLETAHHAGQVAPGGEEGEKVGSSALLPYELLQAIVTPYREQLQTHEARIQRLEGELETERAARLRAEIDAARLAGKLETLVTKEGEGQEGKRKAFNLWNWLLGKE